MGTFAETTNVDYRKVPVPFIVSRPRKLNFHFPYILKRQHICRYIAICCHLKWKTEAQAIFLNPFTVWSSQKRKFVVCPLVYEETNKVIPFQTGLTVLTDLPIYGEKSQRLIISGQDGMWRDTQVQLLYLTGTSSSLLLYFSYHLVFLMGSKQGWH
jgi:hypothetical protein